MSEDLYSLWEEPIRKAAKQVIRDFTELEEDDIFQDLMVFILSTPSVGSPDNPAVLSTLNKKAVSVAWNYRKAALAGTSQYSYRSSDVRKILEVAFDRETWEGVLLPEDQQSEFSDDKWVANIDVLTMVGKLPLSYRKALVEKYAYNLPPKDGNARVTLSKAVRRVTDLLNADISPAVNEHTGIGSRRVIRNATASHIIQELG